MRTIDLRSDTVTLPTAEMREAMYRAEVGDDVYGEDPTVNKLEALAAAKVGKEAGLFVSSGTMGNLLALLAHCRRGDEAIVGSESHIVVHEQGGSAVIASVHPRMLQTQSDGTMRLEDIEAAINPSDDFHFAYSRLLCLENTWHGVPLSIDYMTDACALAHKHGLQVHQDGARIFNAAVASGVPASTVAADCDSVQFCFSKGLAAPMGSALCGSADFIAYARRLRKMVGGGMRQAGFAAAAAIVALEQMVERLAEDHENARLLCTGLSAMNGLKVHGESVKTNMVFFEVDLSGHTTGDLLKLVNKKGVLAFEEGKHGIRFVTHYGISAEDIKEVLARVESSLVELSKLSRALV